MKSVGLVCIDMISGRHRTSNRVVDICSHMQTSNTLYVLATNGIRLQRCGRGRFVASSQVSIPTKYTAESLLNADISYHMNMYETNRRLKKT